MKWVTIKHVAAAFYCGLYYIEGTIYFPLSSSHTRYTHYTVATQAACQTNGMVETDSILFFKFSLAVFRVGSFLFGSCDKVAFVVFLSNVCIYRKTSTGCVLSAKEKT